MTTVGSTATLQSPPDTCFFSLIYSVVHMTIQISVQCCKVVISTVCIVHGHNACKDLAAHSHMAITSA